MKITQFSVEHSTAVFVLIVCLFIGGILSYSTLPREAAPDIPIPVLIVSTPYFGVSPSDIETLVTQPMEKELKSLKDVKKMTSTSAESVSLVTIEFETNVNIDDALQKVREKVDKAKKDLPKDAEDSEIVEINTSEFPVLLANISGDMDPARLKEVGEAIKDDLEKITGVLRVDIAGGVEREIQILVNPEKMRHHGVSMNQIINTIQTENVNLPGGSIELGSMKYLLRVPGEFEDIAMIGELVVKSPEGQQIRIKDVAEVRDGYKEQATYSRLTLAEKGADGTVTFKTQPNLSLSLVKRSGENIIEIADKAKEVIKGYQKSVGGGISIAILNDQSEQIRSTVHDLENNIISGMLLVLLVLFFFMGGARNAIMVALSIPLSMLLTFLVLSAMGITLNMVVLFALILALGMLVDNAIVIVENIYRHANEGKDIRTAALDGTIEVGWPVIASTATTVGAFLPMAFWPGVIGKFMSFLPTTVIITLLSSLFVALVINPTIAAVFLRVKPGQTQTSEYDVPDNAMYRAYRSALEWSLRWRSVVVGVSIVAFIGTFMAYGKLNSGVQFFPEGTPELFVINVQTPDGSKLDATDKLGRLIIDPLDGKVDQIPGLTDAERAALNKTFAQAPGLIEAWTSDVGVGGQQGFVAGGKAPHFAKITVDLVAAEDQKTDPGVLMNALRKAYAYVPGANIVIEKQQQGPPKGKAVNIEVVGDDLVVMADIARQIKDQLNTIEGIIDLSDDAELTRPEIVFLVDRQRAALAGVSTNDIAMTLRTAVNGTKASTFRQGDDEYDITVRLPEDLRQRIEYLQQLNVVNRDNKQIPITEVARMDVRGGTGSIRHKDQDRMVTVSANAADGYLAAELLKQSQEKISKLTLPPGYSVRYTGENEDQAEAGAFLGKAMLLALFIIALILVTQFNSILQPFIILCSVLLSLVGVLWSLILFREPFGVIMTGIGVISLAGVVVNNAIVLIDYANLLRERGMTRREALITAGLVRFRPVMLTAVTTVLGLAPLVVGISIDFVNLSVVVGGRSVEFWGPMARALCAGLIVATLLTLIVVPVLYSLLDDVGKLTDRMRHAIGGAATAALVLLTGAVITLAPTPASAQPTAEPNTPAEATPEFSTPKSVQTEQLPETKVKPADVAIPHTRTLTLAQARQIIQRDSYDVKIAATNIQVADATISKAYSAVLPTVSARFQGTLYDQAVEAQFPGPNGVPMPVTIRPQFDYNFAISASMRANARAWPLLQQAKLGKTLSEEQVAMIREELSFAATQTYYNLLILRRVVELSAEQLASDRTNLEATARRRKAGVARPFELTRAQLRVKQSEQGLERARLQFIQARQSMALLLQTPADFDLAPAAEVKMTQSLETLQKRAISQRASVRVQRLSEQLADKQHEEVYWQYLPTLDLTGTAFRPRATAFNPGEWQYSLGITAQWVIWDGGIREATLDERAAQLKAARLRVQQSQDKLKTDLATSWSGYLSSRAQVASARSQVELAEEALKQSQAAYEQGAATQLDVIVAEDQLRLTKISLAQEELRQQLAIRQLMYLAGDD